LEYSKIPFEGEKRKIQVAVDKNNGKCARNDERKFAKRQRLVQTHVSEEDKQQVDTIFQEGSVMNADAMAWYKSALDQEERAIIDEGIETMLHQAQTMAKERVDNTNQQHYERGTVEKEIEKNTSELPGALEGILDAACANCHRHSCSHQQKTGEIPFPQNAAVLVPYFDIQLNLVPKSSVSFQKKFCLLKKGAYKKDRCILLCDQCEKAIGTTDLQLLACLHVDGTFR
jgi:hypothetical protein